MISPLGLSISNNSADRSLPQHAAHNLKLRRILSRRLKSTSRIKCFWECMKGKVKCKPTTHKFCIRHSSHSSGTLCFLSRPKAADPWFFLWYHYYYFFFCINKVLWDGIHYCILLEFIQNKHCVFCADPVSHFQQ